MKKIVKILYIFFIFVVSLSLFLAYSFFYKNITPQRSLRLYIRDQDNIESQLGDRIKNKITFKIVKKMYQLRGRILREGSYLFQKDISNFDFFEKITKGEQTPIKLVINYFETKEELSTYLGEKLMFSKEDFLKILNDNVFLQQYNLNNDNVLTIFFSNTYEVYWNVTPRNFIEKMYQESQKFWNKDRLKHCKELKLTPTEVVILSSIVQKEVVNKEEISKVAGVFINRLRRRMRLEADSTAFYGFKYDPETSLVNSTKMRSIKTRYNTYRIKGLPPGPICTTSQEFIDGVLNFYRHNFYFFVTAPDRKNHLFSTNYKDHIKNIRFTFKIKRKK